MITVNEITMETFMIHESSTIRLPAKGIVLFTGNNGEGKSAVIDAVSYALWGKTLRNEPPWDDTKGCTAKVHLQSDLTVTRTRGKTSATVGIVKDSEDIRYQTASKAQEYLDAEVGPYHLWLRTCVFSTTSDESKFTRATDKERKQLLEKVLGLEKFDVALARCRADLSEVRADIQRLTQKEALAAQRLAAAEKNRADVAQLSSSMVPTPDPKVRESLARDLATAQHAAQSTADALRVLETERSNAAAEEKRLTAALKAAQASVCRACGQDIAAGDIDGAQTALDAHLEKMESRRAGLEAEVSQRTQEQRDALQAARVAQSALADWDAAQRHYRAQHEQRLAAHKLALDAENEVKSAREAMEIAQAGRMHSETEISVLEQCEHVLGLRGVRAQILARSLDGIQISANAWLQKIGGPEFRVRLLPYKEKKTKGTTDAISLQVQHPKRKTWHSFRAASQGQQRRFDVAMVFALADFARASMSVSGGTLFLDEVFDALDPEGVDRVCESLREIAKRQCVCVISHNENMKTLLKPDRHVRVENGTFSL